MRIDKYLKTSRLIKRRSVAKEACDRGRILVNGKKAKAGTEVKIGDTLLIQFGNSDLEVRIAELNEKAKKEEASSLYEVISQKSKQIDDC